MSSLGFMKCLHPLPSYSLLSFLEDKTLAWKWEDLPIYKDACMLDAKNLDDDTYLNVQCNVDVYYLYIFWRAECGRM